MLALLFVMKCRSAVIRFEQDAGEKSRCIQQCLKIWNIVDFTSFCGLNFVHYIILRSGDWSHHYETPVCSFFPKENLLKIGEINSRWQVTKFDVHFFVGEHCQIQANKAYVWTADLPNNSAIWQAFFREILLYKWSSLLDAVLSAQCASNRDGKNWLCNTAAYMLTWHYMYLTFEQLIYHVSDGEIYSGAELTSWTFQWDLTLQLLIWSVLHINGSLHHWCTCSRA